MRPPIESCLELRAQAAANVTEVLARATGSELEVASDLAAKVGAIAGVLPGGWYAPPPNGVCVLFGEPGDEYERTRFDSLRLEQHWPSVDYGIDAETVGILHVSPLRALSGIIGDWGATLYRGNVPGIQQHISSCLGVVEQLAEFSEPGMEFGDVSRHAGALLRDAGLTTARTLLVNRPEATGINCGHTIPWTTEAPTSEEAAVLASGNQQAINQLISSKRIFINANEPTAVPSTGAFTTELRLESLAEPGLPNTYFHVIVAFEEGRKRIAANLNGFFAAVGMDYIRAKY